MKVFPVWALLGLGLLGGCAAVPRLETSVDGDSFTIIALPDTQYYAARLPEAFERQTKWIADNAERLNIRAVLGLGDVVDNGADPAQWANAMRALKTLKDRAIPHFLAIGNHDYDGAYLETQKLDRDVVNFNKYVGPAYYEGMPGYGGAFENSHENFYGTFSGGGRDYLVIALEFSPRDKALSWASGVINSHPRHEVIVITHSYLYNNSLRVTRCANHTKRAYGMDDANDGEEVWAKFVTKHPRIRLVLSGHIPKIGVGKHFSLGESGNLVNELLSDFQKEPNAGNGWLRIMTVRPRENRIDVSTYSPYLEAHPELAAKEPGGSWKRDPQNRFSLDYEKPAPAAFESGTIEGIVRSYGDKDRCKPIEGVVVRFQGGITSTDADGHFTAIVSGRRLSPRQTYRPLYQDMTFEASKPGWETAITHGTVRSGASNAEQIYLVPAVGQ
jgi:hypothetical protein